MVSWLAHLARAALRPAPVAGDAGVLRALLRQPRVFDVLSAAWQLRDGRRQRRIAGDYAVADAYHRDVHDYNAGRTLEKVVGRTRRAEELVRILAASGAPRRERLLLIGPRNVHELLLAWVHGWRWSAMVGIDLYSTNPKILVMNMEEMSFPDCSFEAVLMSNTLSYAKDVPAVLAGVARVLRPGGRAAFGATYCPGSPRFEGNAYTGEAVLAAIRAAGLELFHYAAKDKVNALGLQQTAHLFGVRKPDREPGFDRIRW